MNLNQAFEQQIKRMQIPNVDVHRQVMDSIQRERFAKQPCLRLKMGVVLSVMIGLFVTGFASASIYLLQDSTGDTAFRVQPFDSDNPMTERSEIEREAFGKLEPGEAIAVYDPNRNQPIISAQMKPFEVTSYQTLVDRVAPYFRLPAQLASSINFQIGYITYDIKNVDIEQMRARSDKQGGAVVYEPLEVKESIAAIALHMEVKGEQMITSVYAGEKWEQVFTNTEQMDEVEKITYAGSEALLFQREGTWQLMYRANVESRDHFYMITTDNTSQKAKDSLLTVLSWLVTED